MTTALQSQSHGAMNGWASQLRERVVEFVTRLAAPGQPGRIGLSATGLTRAGRQLTLGPSCLAAKTLVTIAAWDDLPADQRAGWIARIQGFQTDEWSEEDPLHEASFVDPVVRRTLTCRMGRWRDLLRRGRHAHAARWPAARLAETKQALVTLHQLGAQPLQPYPAGEHAVQALLAHLERLDWSRPWSAGGQTAAVATILVLLSQRTGQLPFEDLQRTLAQGYDRLADRNTGGYFWGAQPETGELVNGAMKVLTALDWLQLPIHYPRQLIDTCLAAKPRPTACHLADTVYVLYRCGEQTAYRAAEVRLYARRMLARILRHACADGGFAFEPGRGQTRYYNVRVSRGRAAGDIHGTSLLTWALAMIFRMLQMEEHPRWRVWMP